eukprot:CAMPEP_0117555940 /NCGR_PEP_ID=MMETSP0784-20121206/51539_1 /TAXON_ID=39447 /ORGANISM="" /LENGTH=282 /DNA_ID=CAMNT_0005353173 /DNA_START=196 /DNA_END=1044 /DNA_ORIENTATION=+
MSAYRPEMIRARIQTIMQQAKRGDPRAQYELGMAYLTGDRVDVDAVKAAVWLEKAAAFGVAAAQINVGLLFLKGDGVAQDITKAVSFISAASAQGVMDADANYSIGQAFLGEDEEVLEGSVVRAQWAAHYFNLAAQESHAPAQYEIGRLFLLGKGMEQDAHKAASWVSAAANQGHHEAQLLMGTLLQSGTGVEQNSEWAKHWFTEAAKNGNVDARRVLQEGASVSTAALLQLESIKVAFAAQESVAGRKAFLRKLRLQHHPDQGGDPSIFRWAQTRWENEFR